MSLNIKLNGDRVIIEADPIITQTKSGIYIPESAQEKPAKGTIVATGPGRYADLTGSLIPMEYKVGDEVLYGKYSGQEIEIDGQEYLIMNEADLYFSIL